MKGKAGEGEMEGQFKSFTEGRGEGRVGGDAGRIEPIEQAVKSMR